MTRPPALSPASLVGAVSLALFEVGMAVSLAALLVQGVSEAALPRLIGALLVGAALGIGLIGARSSVRGVVSSVQDTPVVVAAGAMSALVADISVEQEVPTVLVFVALTGLVTGVVLWALGACGLGEIVRYLPAPVMSGFRLGTAWLLFLGGVEVALGRPVDSNLIEGAAGASLLCGFAVGAVVVVTGERRSPPAVLSGAVLCGVAAFVAIGSSVSSLDQLEIDGWFLGPFDSTPRWRPVLGDLGDVDWAAIAGQAPTIAAVAFIAVTGLLLNTGAIEAELDVEADVDADLRMAGLTNALVGAAGSSPVYAMYSGTVLADRLGLTLRRHLVLVASLVFGAFLIGSSVATFTPRFVAGGLLVGLGASIAVGWLREQHSRSVADLVSALLVAGVIAVVGVLEGVAFGIVMAVVIFVRRYATIDPARRIGTIVEAPSRRDRGPAELAALAEAAAQTLVVELDGFLFFGSAARVRQAVRARVDGALRHLVLDFSTVSGIDESAVIQLRQLIERLPDRGVSVRTSGSMGADLHPDPARHHPDLDHAVEATEDELLATVPHRSALPTDDPLSVLLADVATRTFAVGEDLFLPGQASDGFVLVESGSFGVWIDGSHGRPIRLRRVGPGSVLGELGYANGSVRSARATAETEAEVRVVDAALLAERGPDFEARVNRLVLAHVAARLAATNEVVRNLSR